MGNRSIGKKLWAFSAGRIPLHTTGKEPVFTSHDKIAVLNTSEKETEISITIFYERDAPVRMHAIKVPARRLKKIRFNDLINPVPIPLDKAFGFVVAAGTEVIVQFSRMDTSSNQHAAFCVMPYYKPDTL